jgi:hypothetical protein
VKQALFGCHENPSAGRGTLCWLILLSDAASENGMLTPAIGDKPLT